MPKHSTVASRAADDSSDSESISTSGHGSSSGKSDGGSKTSSDGNNNFRLTDRETLAINRSKIVVALFLLLSATAAGIATFYIIRGDEEGEFKGEVGRCPRGIFLVRA